MIANAANCISSIAFVGDTLFTSLNGDCRMAAIGFAPNETVVLKDNAVAILDAAKAAWLNKCAGGEAAPINGTLKFYGAATLEAFKNASSAAIETTNLTDGDFSKSNTATATFPKGANKFFKAKIE